MNDKVKYNQSDALQLEKGLKTILEAITKNNQGYKKSNTMKVIEEHSDQVKPKRTTSAILNECNSLTQSIINNLKKK